MNNREEEAKVLCLMEAQDLLRRSLAYFEAYQTTLRVFGMDTPRTDQMMHDITKFLGRFDCR